MQWNGASRCELVEKSMETETTRWSEFPNGGKVVAERILVPEEINKSRRTGLWGSQSGIGVGKLTIWVRSFEIKKKYNWVQLVYQFHQNEFASPYDGC